MSVGICAHERVWPSNEQLAESHAPVVRSLVYTMEGYLDAVARTPAHIQHIALLRPEMQGVGGNWENWINASAHFCWMVQDRGLVGRIIAVECGNEEDLWQSAWFMGRRAAEASPYIRGIGAACLVTSTIVSGPDWHGAAVASAGRENVDGVAIHPYGRSALGFPTPNWIWGSISGAIQDAHHYSGGLPVWITECGAKVGQVGGESAQAEYTRRLFGVQDVWQAIVPHMAVFAWHDDLGSPGEFGEAAFGLIARDGRKRPSWWAFCEEAASRAPAPAAPEPWVGEGLRNKADELGWRVTSGEWTFARDGNNTPTHNGAWADKGVLIHHFADNVSRAYQEVR